MENVEWVGKNNIPVYLIAITIYELNSFLSIFKNLLVRLTPVYDFFIYHVASNNSSCIIYNTSPRNSQMK